MNIIQRAACVAAMVVSPNLLAEWDTDAGWSMGEHDFNVSPGGVVSGHTNSFGFGPPLASAGDPRYSEDVPAPTLSLLSIAFDGDGDRFSGPVQFSHTDNYLLRLWAKSTGSTQGNAVVAHNGDPESTGWGIMRIGEHWGFSVAGTEVVSSALVTAEWTQIDLATADGRSQLFVNGRMVASQSVPALAFAGLFQIGGSESNPELGFQGHIDSVYVDSFAPGEFDPERLRTRNVSGMYWIAEEPGWGMYVSEQGDQLFALLFSYAEDGLPMFLSYQAEYYRSTFAGRFIGTLYRTAGTPFEQIDGAPALTAATPVGEASFAVNFLGTGFFRYEIDGVFGGKDLQIFKHDERVPRCFNSIGSLASASNYTDLWWNPDEPGWGLSLSHQGDHITAIWYTYGEAGRDQWFIASRMVLQPDGSFSGQLQQPLAGTPFLQTDGPATTFPVPAVGQPQLNFTDGEHAEFSYQLNGITQRKSVQRFVLPRGEYFRPLCEVRED